MILGGGTGGTLAANRLRKALSEEEAEIVVVDADDRHVYQPGLLFAAFGMASPTRLVKSRSRQLRTGIEFRLSEIDRVDLGSKRVLLAGGSGLDYDVLVVATGASLKPEETEGLAGPLSKHNVHTFYSLEGAAALGAAMARFEGGRLVVNVVDMPIKCPVAPLEFCMLADWYFKQRGVRDKVQLSFATPLDGAFTKQVCNTRLSGLLAAKGVDVVTEFNAGEVDSDGGRLVSYDGRSLDFDLAVVIPLHGGASYMDRSDGLGDPLGFVPVDQATLQAKAQPNVFVIGDAADLPASKAGSVAHFQGEVLVRNVQRFLANEALDASFDGHTNCFIESGFGKALLIDYNYELEPVSGNFPARVGLPLLKESRINHLGKLAFESMYWHVLLPGLDIPGLGSHMPLGGKHVEDLGTAA